MRTTSPSACATGPGGDGDGEGIVGVGEGRAGAGEGGAGGGDKAVGSSGATASDRRKRRRLIGPPRAVCPLIASGRPEVQTGQRARGPDTFGGDSYDGTVGRDADASGLQATMIANRFPGSLFVLAIVALGAAPAAARAAEPAPSAPARVKVVAAPRYKAGAIHKCLLGPTYRRLWTTPVEVEVLDLRTFHGGLKPVSKGGGKQTKSLKFESADGREWRVRSVDKSAARVLPLE